MSGDEKGSRGNMISSLTLQRTCSMRTRSANASASFVTCSNVKPARKFIPWVDQKYAMLVLNRRPYPQNPYLNVADIPIIHCICTEDSAQAIPCSLRFELPSACKGPRDVFFNTVKGGAV